MRAQPVDLIGGFYTDDSLPWSCQDTVNWLPVMAEVAGTRTVSMFATPPGLKPYQQIGTGPIRGMHDCEGLRLIVSGRYLFRISNTGVGVPLGIIPGVGRVQMTHNQFKTGYQVLVENGQGGGGYVYNTVDDTFAKITDEGYPGSISSDYLDSYLLGVEPLGRFWFHSNLADATDYNTLDRYEAEAAPDKIVGLAVSQFEVVVFGQRTIEFFFNAGGQTGTFQNRRQSITRGCASRHTIQKLDNTLFWLGDDGVVYRMEGYAARPVSTRALEKAISGYNWAEAIAFTWEDRGHKVYYLTFPDGQTFGYDVVSGLWHRRESFGINRWRLSHTQKWGRDWFGGDFQNGRIWQLDWDYFLEGDQPIISERTSGVVADNQSAMGIPNAELIFDTGQGPPSPPIPFPLQPSAISIAGQLPSGGVGLSGEYDYTITGEFAPISMSILSGRLPPGARLLGDGRVSYEYTTPGHYQFTVRVVDSIGAVAELENSVMVSMIPVIIRGRVVNSSTQIVLRSSDGLDWSDPPIYSGVDPSVQWAKELIGLDHRIFGYENAANAPGAYSDDIGSSWVGTGENIRAGAPPAAYCGGKLFLSGRRGVGVNYFVSQDFGVTFQSGPGMYDGFVALNRNGSSMSANTGQRIIESDDAGETWSAGVLHTPFFSAGSGLCCGSDGARFYYGGAGVNGAPALISVRNGDVRSHSLPPTTGAIRLTKFAHGAGITLVSTDTGRILVDDGTGFRDSGLENSYPIYQIFWCWTHFILVIGTGFGGRGVIYTSPDGIAWEMRLMAGNYELYSCAQPRSL
ncbi:TPA: hypothetical protein ACXJLS_000397 [Stenotrophomonas maltophilia]